MGKERLDHTIGPFRIISPVFPSNKTTPATNMVAGVVFPQNSDSVPFRFSFGYHNITIPGDRSHHDSRPETRHHRPGQGRQRILHPPVHQRTVLPFDAPHLGILTETDSRTENSGMYDTDTKAPASHRKVSEDLQNNAVT